MFFNIHNSIYINCYFVVELFLTYKTKEWIEMENVFLGQSTVSISKKETVKLLFIKLKIYLDELRTNKSIPNDFNNADYWLQSNVLVDSAKLKFVCEYEYFNTDFNDEKVGHTQVMKIFSVIINKQLVYFSCFGLKNEDDGSTNWLCFNWIEKASNGKFNVVV